MRNKKNICISIPDNLLMILSKTYISHIAWFFTVGGSIVTFFKSKDFKVVLLLCLFSAATTLLSGISTYMIELKSELQKALTDIAVLESKNLSIEENRDALISAVNNNKNKAILFENAYNTAKIGIKGIIKSSRISKDRTSILGVFEDIDNKLTKELQNE